MQTGEIKCRESNFELLRIIAMLCVLCGHFVTKGGMVYSYPCVPQKVSLLFWGGGKFGVSIFMLITGYYANSNSKILKIIRLWFELIFFSLISLALFFLFDRQAITIEILKSTFLPISTETWWYMSMYIFILALSRYINKVIFEIECKEYRRLLLILLIGFCIIPTFIYKANPYFSNLGWLIVLYCIGYYVKKYVVHVAKWKSGLLLFISWLFMWMMEIKLESIDTIETNYFSYMYRLPMLTAAVMIVVLFKEIKLENRAINMIAKYSIGVYLFHDGLFMRKHWYDFINTTKGYGSWLFLFQMMISGLVLYVTGYILDGIFNIIWGKLQKINECIRVCEKNKK